MNICKYLKDFFVSILNKFIFFNEKEKFTGKVKEYYRSNNGSIGGFVS